MGTTAYAGIQAGNTANNDGCKSHTCLFPDSRHHLLCHDSMSALLSVMREKESERLDPNQIKGKKSMMRIEQI